MAPAQPVNGSIPRRDQKPPCQSTAGGIKIRGSSPKLIENVLDNFLCGAGLTHYALGD
jgi:hypothetical protein